MVFEQIVEVALQLVVQPCRATKTSSLQLACRFLAITEVFQKILRGTTPPCCCDEEKTQQTKHGCIVVGGRRARTQHNTTPLHARPRRNGLGSHPETARVVRPRIHPHPSVHRTEKTIRRCNETEETAVQHTGLRGVGRQMIRCSSFVPSLGLVRHKNSRYGVFVSACARKKETSASSSSLLFLLCIFRFCFRGVPLLRCFEFCSIY